MLNASLKSVKLGESLANAFAEKELTAMGSKVLLVKGFYTFSGRFIGAHIISVALMQLQYKGFRR